MLTYRQVLNSLKPFFFIPHTAISGETVWKCASISSFVAFSAWRLWTCKVLSKDAAFLEKDQGCRGMQVNEVQKVSAGSLLAHRRQLPNKKCCRFRVVSDYRGQPLEEVLLDDQVKESSSILTAVVWIWCRLGAAAGRERSSERNYRWARRTFSSDKLTSSSSSQRLAEQLYHYMEKLFVWWDWKDGKRERDKHLISSHTGDCVTAAAEMSVRKRWKHLFFTWLRIQLYCYIRSVQLSIKALQQDSLYVPFSWHSQLTLGSRLDVSVVMCNGYSTSMPRGLVWDGRLFATCGLRCQGDRVWLSPRPVQQNEQRGSVTRLSARL